MGKIGTVHMERDLYIQLIDTITPICEDVDLREVLTREAFFNTKLLQKIDHSGSARVFASRLVSTMLDYGDIENNRPAIVSFLDTIIIGKHVGTNKAETIKGLIKRIIDTDSSEMLASEQSTDKPAPAQKQHLPRETLECVKCGFSNHWQAVNCARCYTPLRDTAATRLTRPPSILKLRVNGTEQGFDIELSSNKTEVLIGRCDPATFYYPDIDLDKYDARNKAVSRMHASLKWDRSLPVVYITDVGSSYGTWLNTERLKPHRPHVLDNDDIIQLGYLVLQVHYHRLPPMF